MMDVEDGLSKEVHVSKHTTASAQRRSSAAAALAALGSHRSDSQEVSVQCRHAHHVAAVYKTDVGLVFMSRTGPHGHGSKDFVDSGQHGARGGQEYVDLLHVDPSHGDDLPAWCDCGAWTLSRADVIGYVDSHQPTVHLP